MSVGGDGVASADYNLLFDNLISYAGVTVDANDIVADPLFAGPASDDYHLQAQSPAVDSGANLGVSEDLDGVARPQGAAADRGAYEFVALNQAPVEEVPIAELAASIDGPVVVGNAIQFTASVGAGTNVSYRWDFGDGQSAIGPTVSYSYSMRGTYMVTVLASNSQNSLAAATEVVVQEATGSEVDIVYLSLLSR